MVIGRKDSYILLLLPALVIFVFFWIVPIFWTFLLSFHEWDMLSPPKYISLGNYVKMLNDPIFYVSLQDTFLSVVGVTILSVTLGMLLAVFLKENVKGSSVIKSIVFLGYIIPMAIVGVICLFIFDRDAGIVNGVLRAVGLGSGKGYLADPSTALYAIILMSGWIWTGFTITVFSAGLENIPRDLYDAARIDGATGWQILQKITLPLLRPATLVSIMMSIVYSIKIFDLIYVTTMGGPGYATSVLAFQIYMEGFRFLHFGYGSALAIFLTLLALLLGYPLLRTFTKRARS